MASTTATLNDVLDDRYNGATINLYLTNGLTYSATTTVTNVTDNDVAVESVTGSAASSAVTGPYTFTFNNTVAESYYTGSSITYDGAAIVVGSLVEYYTNDVSGTIELNASLAYNWQRTAAAA